MASKDESTKPKVWTVMVYLAGDNNLSDECLWAIKEMKRARVGENLNVIAQFDPRGPGIPTQRYVIHQVAPVNLEGVYSQTPARQAQLEEKNREVQDNHEEDGGLLKEALPVSDFHHAGREAIAFLKWQAKADQERDLLALEIARRRDELSQCGKTLLPEREAELSQLEFKMSQKETHIRRMKFFQNISTNPRDAQDYLKQIHSEEFQALNEEDPEGDNTGNPWTLLKFICWGIDNFPADHYMVVLSGHGGGTEQDFLLRDESSRDSLTIPELEQVLRLVTAKLNRKIDILGLDSCLMSMAEVYYQLRGTLRFLVGAEGFEPGTGWPYQRILEAMAGSISRSAQSAKPEAVGETADSKPTDLTRAIASTIVDKYVLYYSDYALAGRSVDLSACEVSESDDLDNLDEKLAEKLAEEVRKLSEALHKALVSELERELENEITFCPIRDAVLLAHWYAQTYMFDQYVDLFDFCDLLQIRCKDLASTQPEIAVYWQEIGNYCEAVKIAIEEKKPSDPNGHKGIVVNSGYSGPIFQHSHGLSVYFPWAHVSKKYNQLAFATATNWHEFLNVYVNSTRRDPRGKCTPAEGSFEERLLTPDKLSKSKFTEGVDKFTEGVDKFTEGVDKFTEGVDKFTEGVDKGLGGIVGSTKNPAQNWCGESVRKITSKGRHRIGRGK